MNAVPAPPKFWRELTTVGVTGTNGKTSTTRWIAAALGRVARPVAQATTLGSFLDDEVFVCERSWEGFLATMRAGIAAGGRYAAIELTSEALAKGFAKAWPCKVGVFTNLSHDHLDAHGTPEHYLASKAQLFVHLPPGGTAVLNACDEAGELIAEVLPKGVRAIRYGVESRGEAVSPLDLRATSVELAWTGTRIAIASSGALPGIPSEITIRALGEVYAENALAALAGAVAAGVPAEEAARALSEVPAPPGRFQVVTERPHVVVDYAHTPDALARTLASARRLTKGELWVVFGAGGDRDKKKRVPMGEAARAADHVVLTSDNPRSEDPKAIAAMIREGIGDAVKVVVELDRAKAIALAVRGAALGDVVLIAGKGHETEQIVGTTKRHFSDVEVAEKAFAART
jgi:UDP-N-acetylmuramoyl-L-alanyl-D-glutamate--2,6-diaminopimelate ligase